MNQVSRDQELKKKKTKKKRGKLLNSLIRDIATSFGILAALVVHICVRARVIQRSECRIGPAVPTEEGRPAVTCVYKVLGWP